MPTDILIEIVSRNLFAQPGTPAWAAAVRTLLRELNTLTFGEGGNVEGDRNSAAGQAFQWLEAQLIAAPDQFNAILAELGIEMNLAGETDALANLPNVGDILNSGGQLTDTIRTIEETTEQTREEIIDVTETGTTTIGQTTTVFVDVPTPEEVLNDFRTGSVTFIDTLFQAGEIDQNTRNFMLQNPMLLFPQYLAALGQRADAGENIFKVVGLDFELIPIEQIGERIGPGFQQQVTETVERLETGELTIEELIKRVQEDLLSGADTEDVQTQIQETINRIFEQHGTTKTTEETVSSLFQLTVEKILQRPNLTTVFALSPLDFLREGFTPTTLQALAATVPGQRQAEQQFAQGIAPSAPRRL